MISKHYKNELNSSDSLAKSLCKALPVSKERSFTIYDRKTGKAFQMKVGEKSAEILDIYFNMYPEAKMFANPPEKK